MFREYLSRIEKQQANLYHVVQKLFSEETVPGKNKTRTEILSEMSNMICFHLDTLPMNERKSRIRDFKEVINRDEKRSNNRPKGSRVSRTLRKSQRIPA